MSDGSRFWGHAPKPNTLSNYVTTRERGDIPGCVPAVDILVEMTQEEVHAIMTNDPYWKVWDDYRFGRIDFQDWKNHPVHARPQRSFIKNPSVPIKKSYYIT